MRAIPVPPLPSDDPYGQDAMQGMNGAGPGQ